MKFSCMIWPFSGTEIEAVVRLAQIRRGVVHPRQHQLAVAVREFGEAALAREEVEAGAHEPVDAARDLRARRRDLVAAVDQRHRILLREDERHVRAAAHAKRVECGHHAPKKKRRRAADPD